jgi:hypothetical protein
MLQELLLVDKESNYTTVGKPLYVQYPYYHGLTTDAWD